MEKGNEKLLCLLTNRSGTLYIGVTNDLMRRVYEHKNKLIPGFTTKYNIDRLVYFEPTSDIEAAIAYEKKLKGWRRAKKASLIKEKNPKWTDLSENWYQEAKND